MKKRIVSLIMALALCLSLLPMAALAEENGLEESLPQEEPLLEEPEEPEELEEPAEPTPEGEPAQPARLAAGDATPANTEHSHPICGASCGHNGQHNAVTFDTEIKIDGSSLLKGSDYWEPSDGVLELEAGNYYLSSNIMLGRTIKIIGTVNLCLNGYSITSSAAAAVFEVGSGATLTLCDCNGSGQNNGTITHTSNVNGRGVAVNGGTFTMYGGTISGNTATPNGGGVYVYGTFNMYGGTISGNNTPYSGGGVNVDGGTFNMYGGTISGNGSSYGGGVYVSGTFTMENGTITGNTTKNGGGGVYVGNGATFTMSGGTITDNTDSWNSAGVFVIRSATFKVSGAVKITDNNGGAGGNVYLSTGTTGSVTTKATITITGELKDSSGNKAQIGVRLDSDYNGAFTENWNIYMRGKTPSDYFTSDSTGLAPVLSGSELILSQAHIHTVCAGTTPCTDPNHSSHSNVIFAAKIEMKDGKLYMGDTEWNASDADYYSLVAGNYYLDSNITVDKTIVITGDVNLCLNGHTITSTANNSAVIKVDGNEGVTTLTLCDCSTNKTGTITHGTQGDSSENQTPIPGNGVYVNSGHTFNMYGGNITGNKAQNGGGVFGNGTFNMYGGAITGNEATGDGGGVLVNKGHTFHMYGGTITENKATGTNSFGGGVYVYGSNASFTMSGTASIRNNEAGSYGGGVFVNGTFTMENGTISDNKTGSHGGGVHIMWSGTFTMENGTITGNEAANNGGGVCVYNGTFTMEDGTISGNTASSGGGVYVEQWCEFKMQGGSITGNNATNHGGGVYVAGTLGVSGKVTITDNVKNGTKAEGATVYTGGTANNVYLSSGNTNRVITIAAALTDGAKIGVNLAANHDGIVTSGWNNKENPENYFSHDGGTLEVALNSDGEVVLKTHEHSWTYTVSDGTITATCNGCPKVGTYTVTAPVELTYNGSAKPATAKRTLTDSTLTGLPDIGNITYKQGDATLSEVPTNAGTYTASITVEGQTASVTYTIAQAEQTITVPSGKTITKNGIAERISDGVSVKGVENEATGATLTYTLVNAPSGVTLTDDKLTVAESVTATEITIRVTAAATTNYKQAEKAFTVGVVNKTAATVTIKGMPTTVTYGDTFTLEASAKDGTTELPNDAGTWSWDFDSNYFKAVGSTNTRTIKLQAIKAGTPDNKNITATYTSNTHQGSNFAVVNEIANRLLTMTDVTAISRPYVPDNTSVALTGGTLNGVKENDDVGFILGGGTMTNANAGEHKPVTTYIQLTGAQKDNYTLTQPDDVTVTITKATPSYTVPTGLTTTYAPGKTLAEVSLSGHTGWSWKTPSESVGDASVTAKTFMAKFTPTDPDNYNTVEAAVDVKVNQARPTVTANDITMTYTGAGIPERAISGTASVPGTWNWKNTAPQNVADSGRRTVVFTPTDTTNYESVEVEISVTISQATPTGSPQYTKITAGGKTLADAALTLTGSTLNPGEGTLEWMDEQGNALPDTTVVEKNKAYKWRFTPTDTNYKALEGAITPWSASSSTVIIIAPSQPATDNTTNPNTGAATGSIGYAVCGLVAAGALCGVVKSAQKQEE